MSAPQKHTIVIVGCGIAGPTLALTILHHPHLRTLYTPVLLDRLPAASAYFAGAAVVLSSNALHPLNQLGLHDAVWAASEESLSTTIWRGHATGPGRRLNALHNPNWSSDIGSGLRAIERGTLMKLLVDAVEALGGEVLWGAKVASLSQTLTGVDVVLEDGRRRAAALVVGADGAWSCVRRHIVGRDGDWKPEFMGASAVYGISRRPAAGTDEEVLGHGHAVLLDVGGVSTWALPGGRQFWCVSVPETAPPPPPVVAAGNQVVQDSEYGHVTTGGYSLESTEALLRRFDTYWFPRVGACGAMFRDSEKIVRAPLWQRVFEAAETTNEAAEANVVVLGDAGRIMLPTSGQGACMAIEDATVLANALLNNPPTFSAVESKPGFAAALHEYSALRIPRSKSIAKQAYWTGIAFMAQRWWWRWLRDFVVAWVPMERDPKGKMERGEKVRDLSEWLYGVRYEVRMRAEGEGETAAAAAGFE